MSTTDQQTTFLRLLFIKRYSLLLEKVENTYNPDAKIVERMRAKILTLSWVDDAVKKITQPAQPTQHHFGHIKQGSNVGHNV